MTKRNRIIIDVDETVYRELEHIAKSVGLTTNKMAGYSITNFILSVKMAAIKLYLNDRTDLDSQVIEAFQKQYEISPENVRLLKDSAK